MKLSTYTDKLKATQNRYQGIAIIGEAIQDAGVFISDKDQQVITDLIKAYGSRFNEDVTELTNIWDPSKNSINTLNLSNNKAATTNAFNKLNETHNSPTTSTIYRDAPGITSTVYPTGPGPIQYTAGSNRINNTVNTTRTTAPTSSTSSTSSSSTYSPSVSTPTYADGYAAGKASAQAGWDEVNARLAALENPRVWSADELAEYYSIQDMYNRDYILNKYNAATNDYYDSAVNEQQLERNKVMQAGTNNYNQLINDYLNNYKYANDTLGRRNTTALNALSTYLGAQDLIGQYDMAMLQSVNQLEKARQAELANNPYLAEQDYNNIGKQLMDWGTTKYTSDVANYVNSLNTLSQYYGAQRNYEAALANAAATRYSGLVNAAAYRATNTNATDALEQYYNSIGVNGAKSSTILNNLGYGITN